MRMKNESAYIRFINGMYMDKASRCVVTDKMRLTFVPHAVSQTASTASSQAVTNEGVLKILMKILACHLAFNIK